MPIVRVPLFSSPKLDHFLENKTIDYILENVTIEDVAMVDETEIETLEESASPGGLVDAAEEAKAEAAAEAEAAAGAESEDAS